MTINVADLKLIFKDLIKLATKEQVYADINFLEKKEMRIELDKINIDIQKTKDKGVKIRVWDGEKFFENGTSDLDKDKLTKLMLGLIRKAKENKNQQCKKDLILDHKKIKKDFIIEDKKLFDLKKLLEMLEKIKEKILKADKDIINSRVVLVKYEEEQLFVNPNRILFQQIPLYRLIIVAFVKTEDGNIRIVHESFADNHINVFDKQKNKFKLFIKKVKNIKKAKKLPGGKYQVILAPHPTGLLAHESFGHGMEADTMLRGRALASDWISKKIGRSFVNIVDYPNIKGKNGQFNFDHEGNITKKTYLVKKGIVNQPIADLYSKTHLNLPYSCNSRCESFDHKNYTRMSNTYFEHGNQTFNELLKKVKDGIFIKDTSGGMEDPKGWGVQIQGCFGQRIKNGKLVDEFYDGFAITGFLPNIIKNISGISKYFEIEGVGSCGKGHKEWIRVSEGGPYLLIDEVILG